MNSRVIHLKPSLTRAPLIAVVGIALSSFGLSSPLIAAERTMARPLPSHLAENKLENTINTRVDVSENVRSSGGVMAAQGRIQVMVRLKEDSLAQAESARSGTARAQAARVQTQQQQFMSRHRSAEMKVIGRTRAAANAVFMEIDASMVKTLESDPSVERVTRVRDYQLSLSETVPYIGATAVQQAGLTGDGVSVAVLDSGIDYLHGAFGGSGDPNEFANNDPNLIEPGSFPTAKVVGGVDFVGSDWPFAPLAPDDDPLDAGDGRGHGTHVADIIGGAQGVAPDVDLYAVKVCSSVTTSCSGIAIIQGLDFAVDPNGDGDLSDHLDIINMSLGADYATAFDDEISFIVDNASAVGVLTVAAAGNGADRPYVAGTPANAPTALSVAQTEVPSTSLGFMEILAPAASSGSFGAVFQPWSAPLNATVSGDVQYGDGAGGNLNACVPFQANSLSGKIVLVDRGACDFSLKVSNVGDAGGVVAIIGLIAAGDPFAGGLGAGNPAIPAFMINLAAANRLRAPLSQGIAASVSFDPTNSISLAQHMRETSSRGPASGVNSIKPEIGAPGASISAIAGSGTDTEAFGGTSGATPMVAGSAALLLQAYPNRSPTEIKALLMNTAETQVMNTPATFGGRLAPITRIGAGEVRVNQALDAGAAAWEQKSGGPLSFGFTDVNGSKFNSQRFVTVRNYSNAPIQYHLSSEFRFADDATRRAVSIQTPKVVNVPANGSARFLVRILVDGRRLAPWSMNSGSLGASPAPMTFFEQDGYIRLTDPNNADNNLHLPWLLIPRQAGDVKVANDSVPSGGTTRVRNNGIGATVVEAYSLIGVSDDLPEGGKGEDNPTPDLRYIGYSTFIVPPGVCSNNNSFVLAFAVNTWERQSHLISPVSLEFDLDVDQDGNFDFAVFSFDASLSTQLADGRNLSWVVNLNTGAATAAFFTEHDTNSGNSVLLACAEDLGMSIANLFQPMDVAALAVDVFHSGQVTDVLAGITISPLGEQYLGVFDGTDAGAFMLPSRTRVDLDVLDFGPTTNNTETGLLLLHRPGAAPDNEASTVLVEAAEE